MKTVNMPWAELALTHIGEAIIATDKKGLVVFLNGAAENLTGVPQRSAIGLPLPETFKLANPAANLPTPRSFHRNREPRYFRRSILIAKNGKRTLVDGSISPILGNKKIGAAMIPIPRMPPRYK